MVQQQHKGTSMNDLSINGATVTRALCDGWEGYRNGRKHLVALDRLIDPERSVGGHKAGIRAKGPCPVCGLGWNCGGGYKPGSLSGTYLLVGVKGTKVATVKCGGRCVESSVAECKCSCGGEFHGMGAN